MARPRPEPPPAPPPYETRHGASWERHPPLTERRLKALLPL